MQVRVLVQEGEVGQEAFAVFRFPYLDLGPLGCFAAPAVASGPIVNMIYGTVQHLEALQAKFRMEYQAERTVPGAYEPTGHICNMVYSR